MGIVIGLDAASSREEWRFDPEVADDAIPYGATCRGVAYYQVPDAPADDLCAARIIWGALDARLIAVDAATGQICRARSMPGARPIRGPPRAATKSSATSICRSAIPRSTITAAIAARSKTSTRRLGEEYPSGGDRLV